MATVRESAASLAVVPVSRGRALTRALIWAVPAAILGTATVLIYSGLNFVPSGVSNRLVDYSIAVIALPLPATALWTALTAVRWLLLTVWPAQVGIFASPAELVFRLGPFGTTSFDAARLDVRYPFELSGDEEAAVFEAFLPEEQQRETLLPRILHPNSKQPLNQVILRFSSGDEREASRLLRPVIDTWRRPISTATVRERA